MADEDFVRQCMERIQAMRAVAKEATERAGLPAEHMYDMLKIIYRERPEQTTAVDRPKVEVAASQPAVFLLPTTAQAAQSTLDYGAIRAMDTFVPASFTFENSESQLEITAGRKLTEADLIKGSREALRGILSEIEYSCSSADLNRLVTRFNRIVKGLRPVQQKIADMKYRLGEVHVTCGHPSVPTAKVTIVIKGHGERSSEAQGIGPVDACYRAIRQVVDEEFKLLDYSVRALAEGTGAIGQAMVVIEANGKQFEGDGKDTDIIMATAYALLDALNGAAKDE